MVKTNIMTPVTEPKCWISSIAVVLKKWYATDLSRS